MPLLDVACAIIEHEGLTLVVQRSAGMDHPLLWEFPGGKLESGEAAKDCIIREIKEELGIDIRVRKQLESHEHKTIRLIPFICSWQAGAIYLHEHKEACWLPPHELHTLPWCPADIFILNDYIKNLSQ